MRNIMIAFCLLVLLLAFSPAQACQAASIQIIVKFKKSVSHPADPDYLKHLSSQAGALLEYLHPMSGEAHVLKVIHSGNRQSLQDVLKKLNDFSDVEYAEEDQLASPKK